MLNRLQNSFLRMMHKAFGILALCFVSFVFWTGTNASATPLVLTNLEGAEISADLLGFDEETRKIQLKKKEETYEYSLSELQFSSKIAVLRSDEMQETLSTKALVKKDGTLLYVSLVVTALVVLLAIGFPTFQGAAFLITGQEGLGLHFKAWMKILALTGLIVGIRVVALGGIPWTDVIFHGINIFRPEDGLALVFALLGSVWLIKHHYHETLKLAAATFGAHIAFFTLAAAGVTYLAWRWYGGDWTIPADTLLTSLILQPFKLI